MVAAFVHLWQTNEEFREKVKIILAALLYVGTIIGKTDLQSVHGGKYEYEPICYRHSY